MYMFVTYLTRIRLWKIDMAGLAHEIVILPKAKHPYKYKGYGKIVKTNNQSNISQLLFSALATP